MTASSRSTRKSVHRRSSATTRSRVGKVVVIAEDGTHSVAGAKLSENREEGLIVGQRGIGDVTGDADQIGLQGVHPGDELAQLAHGQVLANVDVADLHDADSIP